DSGALGGPRLHREGAVETHAARPSLVVGHVESGHAERRDLTDHGHGKVAGLVPFRGMGGNAFLGKGKRRVLDGGLFFIEGEVHGGSRVRRSGGSWCTL